MFRGQVVAEGSNKYVFIKNRTSKMLLFSYARNGFVTTNIREMEDTGKVDNAIVDMYVKKYEEEKVTAVNVGSHIKYKEDEYVVLKVNPKKLVIADTRFKTTYNLRKTATDVELLNNTSSVVRCASCGEYKVDKEDDCMGTYKSVYINVFKEEDGYTIELVDSGYEREVHHTFCEYEKDRIVRDLKKEYNL